MGHAVCLVSQGRFEEPVRFWYNTSLYIQRNAVHKRQCYCTVFTSFRQARSQDCKFGGGSFSVWEADIFRVLLYCYSLLAMSTVSVTEYTNIVVTTSRPITYIWASNDTGDGKLMCRKNCKWDVWGGGQSIHSGRKSNCLPPPLSQCSHLTERQGECFRGEWVYHPTKF